jgi:integrase
MRASEAAQLELNSIRHERGVLIFRVEGETKTLSSQRLVPVHRMLVDLGLERRIADLRAKGETHLFSTWFKQGVEAKRQAEAKGKATLNLHYPKFIPRRFNVSFLPKVGITDERKSWHSYRHSFRTGLELAGIAESVADLLMGHADGSTGAGYTHERSLERLKEAVDLVRFDGLPALDGLNPV